MPTPIGTNELTALVDRHVIPKITDNIYNSNPAFFRLYNGKKVVPGGTQIETPLMYSEITAGGSYSGFDVLDVTPNDTIKNAAWDWKQYHVPVTIDGLTFIKTDSPHAIANHVRTKMAQAQMQMAENLADGVWSDGSAANDIDGLEGAVDDTTVLATYGGLASASNAWWNSQVDAATTTLTLASLQSMFGNCSEGGRSTTLIASRQEQYNRFWALNQEFQRFPTDGGRDEQLANAGFTNMLFNNVPWVVDSHVFDGPNASNSAIVFLNEDYIELQVSPRASFYMQDFQKPHDQDVYVSLLLWAGNLTVSNCARHGKMTALTA